MKTQFTILSTSVWLMMFINTNAQNTAAGNTLSLEQQLENQTAVNEQKGAFNEDDLVQLETWRTHPVNLNTIDEEQMKSMFLLSPAQIQSFFVYKSLMGQLIDIYELQAIPGWDLQTIFQVRKFATVFPEQPFFKTLFHRFNGGVNNFRIKADRVLEKSVGYQPSVSSANNLFEGSPDHIMLKYQYKYKDLMQYGVTAEKDAGEPMFNAGKRKGFDFYSAHFYARKIGIIQTLVLGDFVVNFGQGLIQWQSLGFRKGIEALNFIRQQPVLRAYASSGETNFYRGAGITLSKGKWEATLLASFRKIDANYVMDSLLMKGYVSSFQSSGLHRTAGEIRDQGVETQFSWGGNIHYRHANWQVAANWICHHWDLPLIKSAQPYNYFSFSGNNLFDASISYSYTRQNWHFFGEMAKSDGNALATVDGILMSVDSRFDLGLLYRNISPRFHTIYSNAFTENATPVNENGIYTGMNYHPSIRWNIQAYADFYSFPWLKYQMDAPSSGADYMLSVKYTPNKKVDITQSAHFTVQTNNITGNTLNNMELYRYSVGKFKSEWDFYVFKQWLCRNRIEVIRIDPKGKNEENGFLLALDFLYKPLKKKVSGNFRMDFFETDSYNSRLYAYENDVAFTYSIPASYGHGCRYYINFNYVASKRLGLAVKWSQTRYKDRLLIGSGPDAIIGNHQSEIRVQLEYKF